MHHSSYPTRHLADQEVLIENDILSIEQVQTDESAARYEETITDGNNAGKNLQCKSVFMNPVFYELSFFMNFFVCPLRVHKNRLLL